MQTPTKVIFKYKKNTKNAETQLFLQKSYNFAPCLPEHCFVCHVSFRKLAPCITDPIFFLPIFYKSPSLPR